MNFSFDKGAGDATQTPRVDEHAAAPGSEASAANPGSVSGHQINQARDAAIAAAGQAPRRKYTRRNPANGGVSSGDLQAQINAHIAGQLDQLYAPEAWGALLGLPADAAMAWTGNERWKISDNERKTLGASGSAAARTMMVTNPRALAFAMLGSALMMVYLPRTIAQLKEMREEQAKKNDQK